MTEFSAEYRRTFGVHDFTTSLGQTISVVSAPDWESFDDILRRSRFVPDSVVLSPELITVPDPLEELECNLPLAHRRVIATQGMTNLFPRTTFLLGTPTVDVALPLVPGETKDHRPRNSVVALRDGLRAGESHKRLPLHAVEKKLFKSFEPVGPSEPQTVPGKPFLGVIVCSDLVLTHDVLSRSSTIEPCLSEAYIGEDTDTLLVPAWWATPLHGRKTNDNLFRVQLETFARGIFSAIPNIRDIIVADGSSADNPDVDGPFNVHFQRV